MGSGWRISVLCVALMAMGMAACTPATSSIDGGQYLRVTTTGRRAWTAAGAVEAPAYSVGAADDGTLVSLAGARTVGGPDGDLRVLLDLARIGDSIAGRIEVTNVAQGKKLIGFVSAPAPKVRSADPVVVRFDAESNSVYRGALVPGSIGIELTVGAGGAGGTTTSSTPTTPPSINIKVPQGGSATAQQSFPDAVVMTSIRALQSSSEGSTVSMSAHLVQPSETGPGGVAIAVAAATTASTGTTHAKFAGTYCTVELTDTEACRDGAARSFSHDTEIAVVPAGIPPGSVDGFTVPDPTRWTESDDGVLQLPDQITIIASEGRPRSELESAIAATDGVIVGASDDGIFEARYPSVASTDGAISALVGNGAVQFVGRTSAIEPKTNLVPDDWSDDGPEATLPFTGMGTDLAWDTTTGNPSVTGNPLVRVGIIDVGIWSGHPELRNEIRFGSHTAFYGDPRGALESEPDAHGTHVAAAACSEHSNGGLVGVMSNCSLQALDASQPSWAPPIQAAEWHRKVRRWLDDTSPSVVNLSIQTSGAHPDNNPDKNCVGSVDLGDEAEWRKTFRDHPSTFFVIAAGNCGGRGLGVAANVPAVLGGEFDNVLTVSATMQHEFGTDAPLYGFSAPDGEVAAIGGVWSAVYTLTCGSTAVGCTPKVDYAPLRGTSQAAPLVTGTVGLMLSVNPAMTTGQIQQCLQVEANRTNVTNQYNQPAYGLREIRTDLAVACAERNAPLSGVTAIAAGGSHTCAIVTGGTVKCWGANNDAPGVDGEPTSRLTPATVPGVTEAIALVAGNYHTCALVSGGTVKCWGWNSFGQLGDGTNTLRTTPMAVPGLTGVTALAAGSDHTCAVVSDGTVRCWGINEDAQLGDGTTVDRNSPAAVVGVTNAMAVAAGDKHTCALLSGATVKCWGWNGSGQIGDGTTTFRPTAVTVSGLANATALAAYRDHTCAVVSDDTVKCWGSNSEGWLGGAGETTYATAPTTVSGLANVAAVAAGYDFSCALKSAGTASCWGANFVAQLGDGTRDARLTPTPVSELTHATSISSSYWHTCAIVTGGTVKCWGYNLFGELGDGTRVHRSTPVLVVRG